MHGGATQPCDAQQTRPRNLAFLHDQNAHFNLFFQFPPPSRICHRLDIRALVTLSSLLLLFFMFSPLFLLCGLILNAQPLALPPLPLCTSSPCCFFLFLFRSSHEGSRKHVKRAQSVCAMTGYLSSKGHLGSCDVSFFLRTDGVVRPATFFFT